LFILIEENYMKRKACLLVLAAIVMILVGCGGTPAPVSRSGEVQRSVVPPNLKPSPQILEPARENLAPWLTAANPDGSITIFTAGNVQIKILPMTFSGTRGALDRSTSEFDALIAQYTKVIEENPSDYDTCIKLACLYIDRGKPGDAELAIQYSDKALQMSNNDPAAAYYTRGIAYSEKGDNKKAVEDLHFLL
jgi:tetratricopeptide (TPR) repeat protein